MDTIIKGGTLITSNASYQADIGILNGKIAQIGHNLDGATVYDATGKWVTPGAVDVHVHMELDLGTVISSDTFYTGTRAGLFGGTTAIVDFIEAHPDESLHDAFLRRKAQADSQVVADYGLHITLTPHDLTKLEELPSLLHDGLPTFKLYMAYGHYLDDGQLLRALQAIARVGGLAVIHAENWRAVQVLVADALQNGHSAPIWHALTRPASLEAEAVGRVIDLAHYAHCPIHIFHVGCASAVERIVTARAQGIRVTGETCPQYLFLDETAYQRPDLDGALAVCAPPLRPLTDQRAMWHALQHDHLQLVSTDHAPFTRAQKQHGLDERNFTRIPGGIPSIESRFTLLYNGVRQGFFSPSRWVELCCTRPAKLAGFTHKGDLAIGYDADLVVFDPQYAQTLHHDALHENVDWTPYEGQALFGKVSSVWLRGKHAIQEGACLLQAGEGQFVERRLSTTF